MRHPDEFSLGRDAMHRKPPMAVLVRERTVVAELWVALVPPALRERAIQRRRVWLGYSPKRSK